MEQKCYIYSPDDSDERASKRRRIACAAGWSLREQLYGEFWAPLEHRIQTQSTLEEADSTTLEKIIKFVSGAVVAPDRQEAVIPTGLILAGSSIASHRSFFDRLGRKIVLDTGSTFVLLTSGECLNLKALVKSLIKKLTSRVGGNDDEEDEEDEEDENHTGNVSRIGPKLRDYDLVRLQEWYSKTKVDSIVVAIQDSEAFDFSVLAEMAELLSSWMDRLPFLLLFGIATSSESFQSNLSGAALRLLKGEEFNVTQADDIFEKIFCTTVGSPEVSLYLGPDLSRRLVDRQKDHVQSVQDFSDAVKYAYMCHFYANPLSVFLSQSLAFGEMPHDVWEATRNLPSFRRWVNTLLEDGRAKEVRRLLESDRYLYDNIKHHIASGQTAMFKLVSATSVLAAIRVIVQKVPHVPRSSLYIRSTSGELNGSPLIREMLLMLSKVSSDTFSSVLTSMELLQNSYVPIDIAVYRRELDALIKRNPNSTPLRSQHDVKNNSLRTTIVAQKVQLSKHKSTLSELDSSYSELVRRFHDDVENYFEETLIDPRDLFLSEILLYDLKSPLSEVFAPKPRFAIERALSSPHDYLGCDCCSSSEGALSGTQPVTAILYQLYLESGSIINVNDLWMAFHAIIGEENDESESNAMALFEQALANLKFLGLVKESKRKADHISKTTWKGL
ncbi:hypothetical protein K432DRAFT_296423 [Lepidopterella palustris CBS 459.81]|uniref:Origin recognition complex subunit n=1 Tax=Lepidopterella palustris CBS 459.81 TaxID=1314670 RepID=A0A8E2EC44_9PEZI|nr:hypothetical protein K432DRAFT_296423 [Lepidopterella palustris CBS 459.81]